MERIQSDPLETAIMTVGDNSQQEEVFRSSQPQFPQGDFSTAFLTSNLDSQGRKKTPEESDDGKYVCRFCGKRFARSQALGGHMNVHRKERVLEAVCKARRMLQQDDEEKRLRQAAATQVASEPVAQVSDSNNISQVSLPRQTVNPIHGIPPANASQFHPSFAFCQNFNSPANNDASHSNYGALPQSYSAMQALESPSAIRASELLPHNHEQQPNAFDDHSREWERLGASFP